MAKNRINQACAKVVNWDSTWYWIRITRRDPEQLAQYYRAKEEFRYMKIYDILNYRKGGKHKLSPQTGYITQKGLSYRSYK